MLWRYLKAGRYYNQLRESSDPELAAMPALGEAPCKAAPESLELLDKISKAAPPKEAAELAKSTLAGDSGRDELREALQDYKSVMPTAEEALAEATSLEALAAYKAQAGAVLQALRKSRGAFLAGEACHQWTLHSNVTVDASCFGAVGVELATPEQPRPGLHGVQIAVEASALPPPEQPWPEAAAYVDTLWLAVPAALSQQAQVQAPSWVGVVAYHEFLPQDTSGQPANRLQVARPAGPNARQADLRGELALELLRRML
jgi:hypothetical protein